MIDDISTRPLEEQVYRALEEQIISGERTPGATLTEMAVAEQLGVSRTPVRTALSRLADEGLVELIPHKGARVVGISREDLIATYKIRMRLEGLAARMATERITREQAEEMRRFVELSDYYASQGDADRLKDMDTEFHSLIYRASGSRMLTRILVELHRNVRAYRRLSFTNPSRSKSSREEHRGIMEAIIAGDGELADSLTVAHVEHALKNMIEYSAALSKD